VDGIVDAVIGNYNGERFLDECLESLEAQTLRPRRTYLVDAGSTDDSVATAERLGVTVITAPNRGLGYLYNRGVEQTDAAFVFVANNDIALAADCLERLAGTLEADESAFAADPRQDTWTGDGLVHARTTIGRGPLLRRAIPGFTLDLRAPADSVVPTVCTNAGAMLVRRDMYRALGGFDETYFLDFEDLDLCWRAWARGWRSVHVPEAAIRHYVGGTHDGRRRALTPRYAQSHHNIIRWALKCLPARDAAIVVAGELLRLPRHPLVVGRGLAAVVPEVREVLAQRRSVQNRTLVLQSLLALRDGRHG
jgi:GT2 family glycosyltransferase